MKVTPELLRRYAAQQCTPEEIDAVEQWLEKTSEGKTEQLIPTSHHQERRIWENIEKETSEAPPRKVLPRNITMAVASVLLLLVSISFVIFLSKDHPNIYQTNYGEIQTVILNDGTRIVLNANTKLTAPEQFEDKEREVWLEGEAFFQVAKDSQHPFIVHTASSETRVIGTEFNLTEYPGENPRVTLSEGKVAFSGTNNDQIGEIILSPNEQVTLINGAYLKKEVEADNFKLWIREKFYIDDEVLATISKKITNIYGVEVLISRPELAKRSFRGALANNNLEVLMEDLSFVLDFNYKRKGDIITIY